MINNKLICHNKLKQLCTSFYYWWHNQPGSNTEQGFEQWFMRPDVQAILAADPEHEVASLAEALEGLLAIIEKSEGVSDYHYMYGVIAKWCEFDEVEIAEEALALYRQQAGDV